MRLKLIILGTTAASLFGIALAIPFFIDLSSYKTEFSARASKIIGHPVKIDGDISLSLLPTPHIAIEKISAPNLLRLKQINLNLDFWPLLTKKAVIHSIALIKPDLQFQKLAHDPLNLGLPLEKIIIQEGRLTYASKGQKTRFKDIDLTFDVKKNQATGSFVFLEKEIRFNVSKSTLELSIDKIFLRTSGKLIFTEHSLRFGNNLSIDWQHAFKIEGNFKNLPQKTELNFIANQNNSTWNGNINLNSANSGDFLRDFGMENLPKVYFRP
ncbi:MAG: AsmA family protein, partial [Myxococcaceae bacterium]